MSSEQEKPSEFRIPEKDECKQTKFYWYVPLAHVYLIFVKLVMALAVLIQYIFEIIYV